MCSGNDCPGNKTTSGNGNNGNSRTDMEEVEVIAVETYGECEKLTELYET